MEAFAGRPAASYYLLALFLAVGVVWFATNLRHSRVGRALAAGRDSDAAARSVGIDPAHYRLVALSFSAVVAALGGILLAYGEHPLDPTRFAVFLSVQYFLYTVVGGARSLAGAAVVVCAFEVVPALGQGTPPTGPATVLVLGALAAVTVGFLPGGLAGLASWVTNRLAPAPEPVPAMAGATGSAGFIDLDRGSDPNAFPFAADDPDASDA
jgi:branched-chain amino acid transport system permease protein